MAKSREDMFHELLYDHMLNIMSSTLRFLAHHVQTKMDPDEFIEQFIQAQTDRQIKEYDEYFNKGDVKVELGEVNDRDIFIEISKQVQAYIILLSKGTKKEEDNIHLSVV